jgi:PAS domain S-box-containing protein
MTRHDGNPGNEPMNGDDALNALVPDGPINILIVDDEPRNLTVLETLLDQPDYRLFRAGSADEALLALVNEEFALIVLDVRMPGMTGFELAQMIKERKKTAQIPIIFLTAYYSEDQHVLEGYGAGAVDYLMKPVNAAVLRAKVEVFAELHRRSQAHVRANRSLQAEVNERRRVEDQLRELTATLEQRVAERTQALQQADRKMLSVMNSITDGLAVLDREWRFTFLSEQGARMLGLRIEQVVGACAWEAFPEMCGNRFEEGFRRAVDTGRTVSFEEYYPEPLNVWLHCHCYPSEEGLFIYFHDVSERKRVDQQLQSALREAEKANLAKSEFLSSMSHELRTPLGAILGFAQLLDSGVPPPTATQKRGIDQIMQAGWYLLDLINQILDLSMIESGRLPLSLESVSLSEVVNESEALVLPQALKRGIPVNFVPLECPFNVRVDRTRLKQVLINLLTNAIKYNRPDGRVDVDCSRVGENHVRVSVRDAGEGISPEAVAQLFQPFNRLGREALGEEGTGIGLVVSKRLIEMMGGSIGVQSVVGEGSVFWIDLPLTDAAEAPAESAPDPVDAQPAQPQPEKADPVAAGAEPQQSTLLYVEDNPANLMLIEELFSRRPHIRLVTANDGNVAVERARALLPDVILMDINLPGISGLEAQKIISSDPATKHIPVIALSANALQKNIQQGLEAGFFRYLTKPIRVAELMKTLEEALKFVREGRAQ